MCLAVFQLNRGVGFEDYGRRALLQKVVVTHRPRMITEPGLDGHLEIRERTNAPRAIRQVL